MISRRGLLLGALAAPVVVRTPGVLMPVRALGSTGRRCPYCQAVHASAVLPSGLSYVSICSCRIQDATIAASKIGPLKSGVRYEVRVDDLRLGRVWTPT